MSEFVEDETDVVGEEEAEVAEESILEEESSGRSNRRLIVW